MKKKKVAYKTFIHIKAVSQVYSVNEIFPEEKIESRLAQILEHFEYLIMRHTQYRDDKLSVQTCVHNPKLFK